MKFLFDLLPVILFFVAYKLTDIYVATAVAIVATLAQVSYLWVKRIRIPPLMIISVVTLVLAGGATLLFGNQEFIKWKPTIIFCCMAIAIGASQFAFNKNPFVVIFDNQIQLPNSVARKLSVIWVLFLLMLAVLNLYFAYFFSTDTWVLFKTFGDTALMFVFIIAQMIWLMPYIREAEKSPDIKES